MLKDSKELENKFKNMKTDKVIYSATMDNFMRSIIFGKNNEKDNSSCSFIIKGLYLLSK